MWIVVSIKCPLWAVHACLVSVLLCSHPAFPQLCEGLQSFSQHYLSTIVQGQPEIATDRRVPVKNTLALSPMDKSKWAWQYPACVSTGASHNSGRQDLPWWWVCGPIFHPIMQSPPSTFTSSLSSPTSSFSIHSGHLTSFLAPMLIPSPSPWPKCDAHWLHIYWDFSHPMHCLCTSKPADLEVHCACHIGAQHWRTPPVFQVAFWARFEVSRMDGGRMLQMLKRAQM